MSRKRVYLGLGSNLENPLQQLQSASTALSQLDETALVKLSRCYRSAPVGPEGQPDYINAAACIETNLEPLALLETLQNIENQQGRVRTVHWGARTLDIDILLYGDEIIDSARLQVPHPRIAERNFVLFPLNDISPNLHFPDGTALATLIARCSDLGIEALGEDYVL